MESDINLSSGHICEHTTMKNNVGRLNPLFRKNGLDYELLERNDGVALYATYVYGNLCGFEVVRIYFTSKGKESITSNSKFGLDGSKCFFAGEPRRARAYYEYLSKKLFAQNTWHDLEQVDIQIPA